MKRTMVINSLIAISFGLFILGIFSPLMTVKQWFIFRNTFSLISGLSQFLQSKQYTLFVIVTLFSVALPLAKILILLLITNTSTGIDAAKGRMIHGLSLIGKWSMIDVFIVAILVVAVKFRGVAEVEIHYGLYVFATAVILIHAATCWLEANWQGRGLDEAG
ncbi:MAG: hypothetical protein ETSY1_30450 [Candidatus Entotheonella factor]|uniref:Paraquat-inducible protein A n=1 Tax=Entotheonella factor TaxID=1429438 RepID=W4LBJ9_ENTF1|nr:paraquat-inducible protein A [Candidatus Entotheonella palauensis]ETW95468.1 MAG: hypothetical protein ETSY1_30450 [Candidatus Entotheonella factor]